ncbi:DUF2142 domain-containing protein [Stenotrophomonas sp. PD6]|uniref:DUF2142 domain-containing protein n=1 Tax=Stenotrophomonas sp. PD6 TaxID=3368612 RepID=UPI003BA3166A
MMRVAAQSERPAPLLWPVYLVAVLLVSLIFSAITPPFQAPDEFDHVKRAYMLGQGQILLTSVDGSPSGGYLDSGLVAYMEKFTPLKGIAARKISSDELLAAGDVRWTGEAQFQTAVGTAYYFPLMYAPQALGLGVGKALDLSVGKSYRLARLLELITCGLLLMLAFRLHRPSAAMLVLLALPMNLFLFGTAVLDPMATSVAMLSICAFMRLAVDRQAAPSWAMAALSIGVLLLCACRANMLPMLLLPFLAWWMMRERRQLYIAIAIAVFVLAWTLFTVKTTVYPTGGRQLDHAGRLLHFLSHPGELASILLATWTDRGRMSFYAVSFVGVLGWLDTPFGPAFYKLTGAALVAIVALSVNIEGWRTHAMPRLALVLVCVGSILMTFLALLVQWTDPASPTVDGVQGRYLMIPLMCTVMALTADNRPRNSIPFYLSHVLAALMLCGMAYASASLLVQRYYTAPMQVVLETLELKPSPPLTGDQKVQLHFPPAQQNNPARLDRIGVRFGTYMTQHSGKAELRVWTQDGQTTVVPFDLMPLVDNGYAEFALEGKPYVGGEVVARDGMGVSVWESHGEKTVLSCVLMHTQQQSALLTQGCPEP